MTITSSKMNRHSIAIFILVSVTGMITLSSCRKTGDYPRNDSSKHSAEVLDKWMTMQLRLMRNATGIPNQAFSRHYVYAGIAAVEALSPDWTMHSKWSGKWNGLAGLPVPDPSARYYYPANVNAAMAAINRSLFPNASNSDKTAIDSLEAALKTDFLVIETPAAINKSVDFGKSVAAAVFQWAESDGYKKANDPYTPSSGPGYWVPTPPTFAAAATPHWGNNRTVVKGSIYNTQSPAPIEYNSDPKSPCYQMVKHVYDLSQNLTDEQKAMSLFWRDVPGVSSPGHWLSILQQVVHNTNTRLDKAALAYALTGAAINDALISCWKTKFQYNLVRPITYIRETMGHSSWNSHLGTPAHPEYPSAHSTLSGAGAAVLKELFGNIGSFTDHTYDYLGFAPRTYSSFKAIGEEAGISRVYAGIHYQQSVDAGLIEGRKVAANIMSNQSIYSPQK
jgi:PAP2 superfamily